MGHPDGVVQFMKYVCRIAKNDMFPKVGGNQLRGEKHVDSTIFLLAYVPRYILGYFVLRFHHYSNSVYLRSPIGIVIRSLDLPFLLVASRSFSVIRWSRIRIRSCPI